MANEKWSMVKTIINKYDWLGEGMQFRKKI